MPHRQHPAAERIVAEDGDILDRGISDFEAAQGLDGAVERFTAEGAIHGADPRTVDFPQFDHTFSDKRQTFHVPMSVCTSHTGL